MTRPGELVPPSPAPTPARGGTHTARWVGVGVLVVAAGLVAVLATRPPAAVSEVQSPLVYRALLAVTLCAGASMAVRQSRP